MNQFNFSRRELLRGAAACTVVGPYVSTAAASARKPGGQEMLRIGLIGCGGRGTGAAVNALRADPNVKLVAMGDVFADMIASSLETLTTSEETLDLQAKIDVPPERRFVGWDAYKGVIAYCRGKVASFKVPRHVVFIEEFPMTESGKIRKADLREDAKRRLGKRDVEA